ncbi:hypothetical protein [Myceligenerans crystallogenes]|uniref:Uncharacterized protein n=1 Tax=Myceligenerans crystallogenes TaxID=316335 RepID=A0ABN2N5B8_9MICO
MSHEDATHGPAPLGSVDPEPLHRAVDELAAALHSYVRTAVGVRSEFGAAEADQDPRVHALEEKVGERNAALFDTLHGALGMHPDLTSSIWEPHSDTPDAEDRARERADSFYLSFLVVPGHLESSLDGALAELDAAGEAVAERLNAVGYDVLEWVSSRGAAAGFDDELAEDGPFGDDPRYDGGPDDADGGREGRDGAGRDDVVGSDDDNGRDDFREDER